MIKINLALRKTAAVAEASGGGTRLTSAGLGNLQISELKDIPALRQLLLFGVLIFAGVYWIEDFKASEVQKTQEVVDKLKEEQIQIKKSLGESRRFEILKKALEEDEVVIRQKLDVVQKLMADRAVPPRLLLALSATIPKDVWLADLRVEAQDIVFRGDALDFSQVSDFMKNLNESSSFKEVTLRNTQQGKDDQGTETAKFEIVVKRR